MRSALVPMLVLAACFDGGDALHKPCENSDQCGRGQDCRDDFCDGPAVDVTGADDDEADDGGDADVDLSQCQITGAGRIVLGEFAVSEVRDEALGKAAAVVAGLFVGDDDLVDLVVLDYDAHALHMIQNQGTDWMLLGAPAGTVVAPDVYDVVATDLDLVEATVEFVALGSAGQLAVARWEGNEFVVEYTVDLAESGMFSLTAVDVLPLDGLPEIIAAGNDSVVLVPNDGAMLNQGAISKIGTTNQFYEPWDVLVADVGDPPQIFVGESQQHEPDMNQQVFIFDLEGTSLSPSTPMELPGPFQNPWALAMGDFDGNDGPDIAIADRRVNQDNEGSDQPGSLRLLDLDTYDDIVTLETLVGPGSLVTGDFDGNGVTDLVVGNAGTPGLDDGQPQILFGGCSDAPLEDHFATVPITDGLSAGTRMAVADFDNDGYDEVAIPDYGDNGQPGMRVVIIGFEDSQ